ncbi:MAG: hypothetical protein K0U93_12310 [Gammaproteobacteria bacterium]|nr:hypothetical protein [Gammaproteobacteria bacterium]
MLLGTVIYAKELRRLVDFYSMFGFATKTEHPREYAVLSDGHSELNVVQIPDAIAVNISIRTPPIIRADTPIKLIVSVPCLESALLEVQANGGLTPNETWEFQGRMTEDVIDPEGNVLQLVQLPTQGQ